MYDVLIRGALIYDGTGSAPTVGDVAIRGDRIVAVGDVPPEPAAQVVEAAGMALLPGFIDAHTHSDVVTLNHHSREEVLLQGVTTEVMGSCGIGIVPMSRGREDYVHSVRAIVGVPEDMEGVVSVATYFDKVGNAATNYAQQIAHSPIRIEALGNRDIPVGSQELKKLEQVTHQAFEEGACALSTGLAYFPAAFCDTEEVVRLCHVAKEHGAPFTIHLRSVVNKHFPNGLDPIGEALEIARKTGVHLHFSHTKTRKLTAGDVAGVVRPIEQGLQEGLTVTADFYPYPAGCGYIPVFLPPWVMDGSVADAMARLADPQCRLRIQEEMEQTPEKIRDGIFSHAPRHPEYLGRSFEEVAAQTGETASQLLTRFLYEEELDGGYIPHMDFPQEKLEQLQRDYVELLRKPYYMLGSDTLPAQDRPHPRSSDSFAKMLRVARKYGLETELLANRLSSNPAKVFGLKDRGIIAPGYFADILLFRMEEGALRDRPDTVFVNGHRKVEGGKLLPGMSGYGLRHNG